MMAPQALFAADNEIGVIFLFCPCERRRRVEGDLLSSKSDFACFQYEQKNYVAQSSGFLQAGQNDRRGRLMDRSTGKRQIQTLRKDPTAAPRTKAKPRKRSWEACIIRARPRGVCSKRRLSRRQIETFNNDWRELFRCLIDHAVSPRKEWRGLVKEKSRNNERLRTRFGLLTCTRGGQPNWCAAWNDVTPAGV